MSKDEPKSSDAFFSLYGMKVRVADVFPDSAVFGIQQDTSSPVHWFGYDKASPEGDYSVVRVHHRYQIDESLLDNLLDKVDYVDIEMRAMRIAADIEASRMVAAYGTNTARSPGESPSFRMDDMLRIKKQMMRVEHDRNIKVIESLLAAGFSVSCNEAATQPTAFLPKSYQEALKEVTGDSDNRDPVENIYRGWGLWPERYTSDYFDDLTAGMTPAEFRKEYLCEFSSEDFPEDDSRCV